MEKPTHEQTGTNKEKQPVGEKGTRTNWHEDEEKQHEDKEKPEPEETEPQQPEPEQPSGGAEALVDSVQEPQETLEDKGGEDCTICQRS